MSMYMYVYMYSYVYVQFSNKFSDLDPIEFGVDPRVELIPRQPQLAEVVVGKEAQEGEHVELAARHERTRLREELCRFTQETKSLFVQALTRDLKERNTHMKTTSSTPG